MKRSRTRLQDAYYMFLVGLKFKGKGESNLRKLAKNIKSLDDWKARASTIKQGILAGAGLSPLPKRTPLNPVIHSKREHDGYSVENVYFESIPGFYVTGNLYKPVAKDGTHGGIMKHPAILKPHGHFKDARLNPDNQHICATLARAGAIVFTYDMVGYVDSTQVEHKEPRVLTFQLWNSIRALDFLEGLSDVDMTRVGTTGASGGGTQTFLLAAVDERVAFPAPLIMVSAPFFGGCSCESGLPIHKGSGYTTNNAEIAAIAAPRPHLIVSIGTDWTRMVPTREFPFINRVYALFGAHGNVENVHIPGERHNLGPSKRQAAYDFFIRRMGLEAHAASFKKADGTYGEEKNTVEDGTFMHAFDDAHPRPPDALQSGGAVLDALVNLQG